MGKGAHKFICVRLRRANKHKCSVRRNGRRADSRGMFERVWVQVPPPAPNKNNPNHFDSDYFCLYSYFFSFHFSLLLFIRIIFYQKTFRQILSVPFQTVFLTLDRVKTIAQRVAQHEVFLHS